MQRIAEDVHVLPAPRGTNAVLLRDDSSRWWLIDPGCELDTWVVHEMVNDLLGEERPYAILLTHGHGHVAGAAATLAREWACSVFCGASELPMVTGLIDYPPVDTTCKGIASWNARFQSEPRAAVITTAVELRDENAPDGWNVLALPGHTPGSMALLRRSDGVLIAGDALSTIDWDQPLWWRRQTKRLRMPPNLDTLDWVMVRRSLRVMADLKPQYVVPAHGLPILQFRWGVATELRHLADAGVVALKGRYVADPAHLKSDNTWELYAPIQDPLGRYGMLIFLACTFFYGFILLRLL